MLAKSQFVTYLFIAFATVPGTYHYFYFEAKKAIVILQKYSR